MELYLFVSAKNLNLRPHGNVNILKIKENLEEHQKNPLKPSFLK